MAINVPKARRTFKRLIRGRAVTMAEAAARSWVICPEGTFHAPPALHPPGAIEAIQQLSPYRQWATEEALIQGGEQLRGATMAYRFDGVDLVDGQLYCGAWEDRVGAASPGWRLPPAPAQPPLKQASLVSTRSGCEFFGCLLLDDFPIELLAEGDAPRVCVPSRPSGHEAAYRELLGLRPRRELRRARVDELTVWVDPPHNPSKSERYRRLRQALRQQVGPVAGGTRVYLRRGGAGQQRLLVNEPELEAALSAQGFLILDPMQTSAQDIARLTLDASLVVSVEGSQISHAIFSMADQATLVVLQPPGRFCLQYKEFTDALDMRFGFFVCTPQGGSFALNLPAFLSWLDAL
jgi:hypothetical protein